MYRAFKAPTITKYDTAGATGTYTVPAGVKWIKVKMIGGGGGGSGGGTTAAGNGVAGNNTIFGTSLLQANGGGAGVFQGSFGVSGGSGTINSPATGFVISGGIGTVGEFNSAATTNYIPGPKGGDTVFGFGTAARNATGGVGGTGYGAGGSGGSTSNVASAFAGNSGGGGAYVEAIIINPSAQYTYTVAATANGGTAGTSGNTGGFGSQGIIIIEEYYQ